MSTGGGPQGSPGNFEPFRNMESAFSILILRLKNDIFAIRARFFGGHLGARIFLLVGGDAPYAPLGCMLALIAIDATLIVVINYIIW